MEEPTRECQVKGAWFSAARRVLLDGQGPEGLARVVDALPPQDAAAFTDAYPSAWYPEETLQRALRVCSEVACGSDPDRFCGFIEDCTVVGLNRFLRAVLSLTSPSYLLAKMPVFWSRHRRNHGNLAVELRSRSARLVYTDFPFFDDANYRIMIRGILRKTLELTSKERPDVTVRDFDRSRLTVDVFFPTLRLL